MSNLAGNLRTMPLPDILQWIATGQKTGTLVLTRHPIEKRLVFNEGHIHSSSSNDPRESLGQFLIRDGLLTEEQLFRALLRQESEGRLLGSILVTDDLITEEQLKAALKAKAEESIYDLFLWQDGQFELQEGSIPHDVLVHVDLDVREVVFEGIRRSDDWARIRQAFPSDRVVFRRGSSADQVEEPLERQVIDLVAAGKSMAEMVLELRRSEYETAVVLFDLKARGVIEIEDLRAQPGPADPIGAVRTLLAEGYTRLQQRRYDDAAKAYIQVLAIDRLNQNAKKGLAAVADARARDTTSRAVPLDKVPHLMVDFATLTQENLDPQEAFVLSRVNGAWDVRSILKLCPIAEDVVLQIFSRLVERRLIELR
jgi:hypothetical protein